MLLIRKTKIELTKKGNWVYFGIFLCPFCLQEVEKQLSAGKIHKSCGCQRYKLSAESNTGKKRTEESKIKISKANKGKSRNKGIKFTEEHKQKMRENHADFKGINHPLFGKNHSEETRQKMKENHANFSLENNPNWNNGSSFEPYSPEFNKELKQKILKRDNYTCQCPDCEHKTTKLDIHHIDYDKKNNNLDNLITLCDKCHCKTNSKNNREYWIFYYQNILINMLAIL